MAPSHSAIKSIFLGLLALLLEALVFVPGSPVGSYVEATLGVSTVFLIQVILGAVGLVLLAYPIYTIVHAVVKWRRTFQAEIVGKDRFLLGESVHFKAWFKGELRHGLFTCDVCLADGSQAWWPAYDTFRRSKNGDLGVLSGRKVHEAEWSVPITKGYPTGQYTVKIGVWDRVDLGSKNTPVKEKQASFWVLPPGYQGSPGISAVLSSGDTGFVIEQRTEADRQRAQDDLKVHYQNLIQRMEQWSYLHSDHLDEMICLASEDEMLGTMRLGVPTNLENDKMHLREFKATYDLYLDGKSLSKEYKETRAKTEELLKASLWKLLEEKGVTIDATEQFNLMWRVRMAIESELKVVVIGGELGTLRMLPIPGDTTPELLKICDELRQHQDLKESIRDELVVKERIAGNEGKFLTSLQDDVIERSKESNYSLPQLRDGVCDDCKHLRAIVG
jgi:hypothetical protein